MSRFVAPGFKPVVADDPGDACRIFARRLARRIYGSKGDVRVIRVDSWDPAGAFCTFQCFVGYPAFDGFVGHDCFLTVSETAEVPQ